MNYALLTHTPAADARDALPGLRLTGFSFVEFPLSAIPTDLSATGRREFRHLLSTHELKLNALHVQLPGKGLMPGSDVDRALDRIGKLLEAARELGARQVVVDLGPLPRGRPAPPPPTPITPAQLGVLSLPDPPKVEVAPPLPVDQKALSEFDAAFIELGRRCDRFGVPTVLRSSLSPVASLADAIARVDCPWFFACCDPAALCTEGINFHDAFNLIGSRISHVLAVDVIKGEGGRTKPAIVGRGDVPWRELLALLGEADYRGPLTVDPMELPDRALAARTAVAQLKAYEGV